MFSVVPRNAVGHNISVLVLHACHGDFKGRGRTVGALLPFPKNSVSLTTELTAIAKWSPSGVPAKGEESESTTPEE